MSPGRSGGALLTNRPPGQHRASPGARQPGRRRHRSPPLFPLAFSQCFRGFRAFRAWGGSGYAPAGNRHRAWRKGTVSDPPGERLSVRLGVRFQVRFQVLGEASAIAPALVFMTWYLPWCLARSKYLPRLKRWPQPWICQCVDQLSHESCSASHPNRAWRMTSDERSEELVIENGRSFATTGRRPGEVEGEELGSKRLFRFRGIRAWWPSRKSGGGRRRSRSTCCSWCAELARAGVRMFQEDRGGGVERGTWPSQRSRGGVASKARRGSYSQAVKSPRSGNSLGLQGVSS